MTAAPRRPRRLVYLGTPDLAVPPLRALHAEGFDIALVVTRADKRRGRGGTLVPSPVKAAAIELGIPVTANVDDVLDAGADLGVVVAFGRIIKPHVLEAVPMVNLHFSLLPRWRGAAPVERAILAGDAETGVCVMAVEEGLDTGGVYRSATVPIGPDDTLAGTSVARWMQAKLPKSEIVLRADSLLAMQQTAAAGLGLVALPCYLGDSVPALTCVRRPIPEMETALWILTHEDLRAAARVRAFTEFAYGAFRKRRALLEGEDAASA